MMKMKGVENKKDRFEVRLSWNAGDKENKIFLFVCLFQQGRISSLSTAKLLRIQSCYFLCFIICL